MCSKSTQNYSKQVECLGCFEHIVRYESGQSDLMLDEDLVIGVCLQIVNSQPSLTRAAIKLLDSFCWASTEGLEAVLLGLKMLRDEEEYPTRFHAIIDGIIECDDLEARYHLMRFVNSLVESPIDAEERNSLRSEFLSSGIRDAIKHLKSLYKLDRRGSLTVPDNMQDRRQRSAQEEVKQDDTSPEGRRHAKKMKTYLQNPDDLTALDEQKERQTIEIKIES